MHYSCECADAVPSSNMQECKFLVSPEEKSKEFTFLANFYPEDVNSTQISFQPLPSSLQSLFFFVVCLPFCFAYVIALTPSTCSSARPSECASSSCCSTRVPTSTDASPSTNSMSWASPPPPNKPPRATSRALSFGPSSCFVSVFAFPFAFEFHLAAVSLSF